MQKPQILLHFHIKTNPKQRKDGVKAIKAHRTQPALLFPTLQQIDLYTPEPVPRQADITSFRFHLTIATVAWSYATPTIKARLKLSPVS